MGTWYALGDPGLVELVSLTPNGGCCVSQVFTAVITDGYGAVTIPSVQFAVNGSISSCLIDYHRASNMFYLLNDAGTAWFPLAAESASQVSNSQCTLRGLGSGASVVGSSLSVTYNLTFPVSFFGIQKIYMQAADVNGTVEVWHQMGTWRVPFQTLPSASGQP